MNDKPIKLFSGRAAFNLYQSQGLPIEVIEEKVKEEGFDGVDMLAFNTCKEIHREISRRSSKKKFKKDLKVVK